jgi:hypothetical protein
MACAVITPRGWRSGRCLASNLCEATLFTAEGFGRGLLFRRRQLNTFEFLEIGRPEPGRVTFDGAVDTARTFRQ